MSGNTISRRRFLVVGSSVAGGLCLGVPLIGAASSEPGDGASRQIGFFVEITPQGDVILSVKDPEIGQGLRTTAAMLIAEELDADWERVSVRQLPLGLIQTPEGYTWKYGGQGVGGSTGLLSNWDYLRQVGAEARHLLLSVAAERLGVDPTTLSTAAGFVIDAEGGRKIAYSELVADAAKLTMPSESVTLKDKSDYRIIGTRRNTVDGLDLVTGRAKYGIDTQVDGMLYAVIARSPILNGTVKSFDAEAALQVDGVIDAFQIEGPEPGAPYVILAHGVAVVANSTWAAIQGRKALKVEWSPGPNADDSTEKFWQENKAMLEGEGQIVLDEGDYSAAIASAETVITRRYEVPFVSHQPLEPQNCFAHVTATAAHIIAPTQMPSGASRSVHAVTGLAREDIHVEMTRVGGGFGRRLTNDYVAEACLVSMQANAPIKLIWTREDDVTNDFYRPAGTHELSAGCGFRWQRHRLDSATGEREQILPPPRDAGRESLGCRTVPGRFSAQAGGEHAAGVFPQPDWTAAWLVAGACTHCQCLCRTELYRRTGRRVATGPTGPSLGYARRGTGIAVRKPRGPDL